MAKQKSRFGSTLFEKNPDTLPFFSIHPKTKVGSILRILLCAFMVIVFLLTIVGSKLNLVFYKYWDLYYLIYVVPVAIIIALVLVALFKRMKTLIGKIAIPGVLGFLTISVLMTIASMLSATGGYAFSMAYNFKTEDGVQLMMMRSCAEPENTTEVIVNAGTENEYTTTEYTYRVDAYKYTAVPSDGNGSVEGEIYVSQSSTFDIKEEWLSDTVCRYYIASDSEGSGHGEIKVTFDNSETSAVEDGTIFRSRTSNSDESHSCDLYRSESYIEKKTTSIYMLTEECFRRQYTAYPVKGFYFLDTDVRVEGSITVEPFGDLNEFNLDASTEGVYVITPTDNCVGASGSITIYLNEKAINNEKE